MTYVTLHSRDVGVVVNAVVVLQLWIDGRDDKSRHFGPHSVLNIQPNGFDSAQNRVRIATRPVDSLSPNGKHSQVGAVVDDLLS